MAGGFLVKIPVAVVDHHAIHLALHGTPVLKDIRNFSLKGGGVPGFGGFAPEMRDAHGNKAGDIAHFRDPEGMGILGADDSETNGLIRVFHVKKLAAKATGDFLPSGNPEGREICVKNI